MVQNIPNVAEFIHIHISQELKTIWIFFSVARLYVDNLYGKKELLEGVVLRIY